VANNQIFIPLAQKALIIETFIGENDNQLTRIAKLTGEPYHRVFKVIENHMNHLASFRNTNSDDSFIELESSINKNIE